MPALDRGGDARSQQQFRKIIGYSDLAKLATRVERDLTAQRAPAQTTTREEAATLATA